MKLRTSVSGSWRKRTDKLVSKQSLLIICSLAVVGALVFALSKAATGTQYIQAESGRLSGAAMSMQLGGASGGLAVHFGMSMNNSLGNILYNATLGARFTQYKSDSEAVVTQNLATRGNYESNPSSPQPGGSNCGTNGCQGQFRTYCQYSHLNYDDPIVYPGQSGKAHLHLYWGNMGVDANTTNNSLINGGGGSCEGYEANRTGYWMPAVLDGNNKVVIPKSILIYYKAAANLSSQTQPMPQGLKMIAGNSKGNTDQNLFFRNGIQWECYTGSTVWTYEGQTIPDTCPQNPDEGKSGVADWFPIKLEAVIYFPSCAAVDGSGKPILDTVDDPVRFPTNNHKDHVAYFVSNGSGGLKCPSTHPYIMPQVSYLISWDGKLNYSGWHLSSDRMSSPALPDGSSLHGDWYGGWNKTIMDTWTNECIRPGANCSNGVIGNAKQLKTIPTDYTGPNYLTLP